MNTVFTVVLLVLAIAITVYIFTLPGTNGSSAGKCSEKDYEIADKVAEKNNI